MTAAFAVIRTALPALLPTLLLGGCVAPIAMPGRCVADETRGWVGQRHDRALERRIGDLTHARRVRVIRHDMSVTGEVLRSRASIVLDERGFVTRIYCG